MSDTVHRHTPLVVVASANATAADALVARLRRDGTVAYAAHSLEGCLRVATAVGPDVVLFDPALPGRLKSLLRAHPRSARAALLPLADDRAHLASPTEVPSLAA
jgi:hypothetical protein